MLGVLRPYKQLSKKYARASVGITFSIAALTSSSYFPHLSKMGFFTSDGVCTSNVRLDGKVAIITGCNTGIGKIHATDLYQRGCKVIMACRSIEKANAAMDEIKSSASNAESLGVLLVKELDLTSFQSIRKCAGEILNEESKVDILVNNAGVMMCPKSLTKDGFELQFGTNHLGHYLFTMLLMPRIIAAAPARILNVSSKGHSLGRPGFEDINWEKHSYNSMKAYGDSKLANIYFTTELARRLEGSGVTTYAIHPGVVKTELGRHLDSLYFKGFHFMLGLFMRWFIKTPEQGAQTQIYCSVDTQAGKETGLYYSDCQPVEPYSQAKDKEAAKKLWDMSFKLVGFEEDPLPVKS